MFKVQTRSFPEETFQISVPKIKLHLCMMLRIADYTQVKWFPAAIIETRECNRFSCEAKFIIFRRVKLLMTSFDKHFFLARFMCSLVWDVDANSSASSAYQLFIVSHEIPNTSKP